MLNLSLRTVYKSFLKNRNILLEIYVNKFVKEESVKISYPWKELTFNKEHGVEMLEYYISKGKTKFCFTNNGIDAKYVNKNDGSGNWDIVDSNSFKVPYLKSKKSLTTLDLEHERFFIYTNLNDPRLVTIIKSTIELFPQFNNFKIAKIFYEDDPRDIDETLPNQIMKFHDYGSAQNLLLAVKKIKDKSGIYEKDPEESSFEEFELEVFKELSDETWYHATKKSNLNSIMKKGILPSGNFDLGSGWTQFNLNLQNAVYITKDIDYAYSIAETLTNRFNEDAVVLKIDGASLKNKYQFVVVDEDSLRDDYDGSVHYFSKNSFINYTQRMPEFIISVVDKIESIGFKNVIEPKYISVDGTVEFKENEDI